MTARVQLLQRLRHEDSGQTLVLCAVFLGLVAIGFVGLAMDVGYLQQQRRRAQSAADAAALAAAYEMTSGYTANEQLVANAVAKQNGFDSGAATNPATVTLSAPATGNFSGAAYVQATVSKPVPLLFMQAFAHQATTVVAASAVAGGSSTSSSRPSWQLSSRQPSRQPSSQPSRRLSRQDSRQLSQLSSSQHSQWPRQLYRLNR